GSGAPGPAGPAIGRPEAGRRRPAPRPRTGPSPRPGASPATGTSAPHRRGDAPTARRTRRPPPHAALPPHPPTPRGAPRRPARPPGQSAACPAGRQPSRPPPAAPAAAGHTAFFHPTSAFATHSVDINDHGAVAGFSQHGHGPYQGWLRSPSGRFTPIN